jgi:hypothetical protein
MESFSIRASRSRKRPMAIAPTAIALQSIQMFLNRRIGPGKRACGHQGLLIGQKRACGKSERVSDVRAWFARRKLHSLTDAKSC